MRIILMLLFCSLLLMFPSILIANDAEIDAKLQEITSTHFSPFCAGRILSDCPSSATTELKDEIRQMLRSGKSVKEVEQHLYLLYGDDIQAMPNFEGVGTLAWIAPIVFLLLAISGLSIWAILHKNEEITVSEDSTESD